MMEDNQNQTMWEKINNSQSVQIFLVFVIIFFGAIAIYLKKDPCENVITYYVNYVSPTFTDSKEDLKKAALQAEFIWEVETLSEIFEYKEGGDLQINFDTNSKNDYEGEFDKGYYENGIIVIHQYYGINDLSLVLAHEFGHALGIKGHVESPQAVMHAFIDQVDSRNLKLHLDDITAIKKSCSVF